MSVLRISAPTGEIVIEGASGPERDVLFHAFSSLGWFIEERKKTDRVKGGWRGQPLRSSHPQP